MLSLLTFLLSAAAASATDATSGADANRPLVIAMGQDFRPFQFVDAAGKPSGLIADFWRLWSEKTGTPIELKTAPWAETLAMVSDGRADVHAGLNLTEERKTFLDYGDPLLGTDSHVFSPVGIELKGGPKELVGFRVGVLAGSLEESLLHERVPGAELLRFDTVDALYDAVAANRVRLFADVEQTAFFFLQQREIAKRFRFDPTAPLDSNYLFAAVAKGNSALLESINSGLRTITASERAKITRRWLALVGKGAEETLIVAVPRNYPPFSLMDSAGQPAGMLIDIWRLWSQKTGRSIKFRASGWADTLYALRTGEADLHSGLFRSTQRAKWIGFSKPIYEVVSSFYHRVGELPPNPQDDLTGRKIGVVLGYVQESFLRNAFPNAEIAPLPDDEELLKALAAGKIDLILSEDPTIEVMLERMGLRGKIAGTGRPVMRNRLHFGARAENTDVRALMDDGVDRISLDELAEIERRWIVNPKARLYAVDDLGLAIDLTAEEQAWLAANPVLRVGIESSGWPPYELIGGDGSVSGLSIDLLKVIAESAGLSLEFVQDTWSNLLERVKTGDVDVLPGLFHTPKREAFLDFTSETLRAVNGVFVGPGRDAISGVDDLGGRTTAIEKGYASRGVVPEEVGTTWLETKDTLDALIAVSSGKADAYVGNHLVASYLIADNSIPGLSFAGLIPGGVRTLHIGVRKGAGPLRDILDRALRGIDPADRARILRRWSDLEVSTAQPVLALTPEERAWIKDHPVLRATATADWPPFESRAADGSYVGITADFARLVARRAGFELEPVFDEWTSHLESLRDGRIDFAPGLYRTKDREEFLDFTGPFVEMYDVIFTQADRSDIESMDDLAGRTVAVEDGYAIHEFLKADYPDIEVLATKNALEALKAVSIGKVDAFIGNQVVAGYLIKANLLQNLKSVGFFSEEPNFLTMATPKDRPILRRVLDKALASITREDSDAIIARHALLTPRSSLVLELTPQERHWVREHPVIRVHNELDWPPFNFHRGKRPAGFSIDYMNLLADRIGIRVEYVSGPSWDEFLGSIRAKDLDVILNIVKTEDRSEFIAFTEPYIENPSVIVARRGDESIRRIDDLSGKTVAVPTGFFYQEVIERDYPDTKLLLTEDLLGSLKAVAFGDADAVIAGVAGANYLIGKHALTNLRVVGEAEGEAFVNRLRIGVRDDWPVLRDLLNKAIGSVTAKDWAALQKQWFGVVHERLALTPDEQQWLEQHRVIRVHNEMDTPPFNFNEFGQPRGFSIDYMNLLADRLGIEVEYVSGPTWGEFIESIKAKDLDVMLNIVQTDEREKFITFTKPYRRLVTGIIVQKENQNIRTLEDLAGKTVAVPAGFFYEEVLKRDHPKIKLLLTDDPLGALQAVSLGNADAAIGGLSDTNLLIRQNSIINLKMAAAINEPAFSTVLRIGVRDDWPELRTLFDKAMRMVEPGELAALEQRWFEDLNLRLDLTPEELDWITKHRKIRAMVGTWPPFHYVEDGEPKGLAVEYMREIAGRLGIEIEFVPILWADAFGGIQTDDKPLDVLPTIARSAEREKVVNITRDYLSFPSVIFTQRDAASVSSLQDLAGKTVAVEENFVTHRRLEKDYPDIELLPSKTSEDALRAVSLGKADAYVGNLAAGSFLIEALGLTNLKIASPSGYPDDIQAVGVRKDWPELAALIDKALASLTEEDHARLRQMALAVELQLGIDRTELFKWVGGVGAGAAIIIGAIVLWNRRLGSEIAERRKIEETLRAVEERTRLVLDGAGEGIFGLDPKARRRSSTRRRATCWVIGLMSWSARRCTRPSTTAGPTARPIPARSVQCLPPYRTATCARSPTRCCGGRTARRSPSSTRQRLCARTARWSAP